MMQDLRVLMATAPIGGVWTYSLELGGALARQGVRVILASMGMPLRASHRRAVFQIPHVELAESAYKLEWMDDPRPAIDTAGEWLRTLVQRHGADAAVEVVGTSSRMASAYRTIYDELLAARRAPRLAMNHGRALASAAP